MLRRFWRTLAVVFVMSLFNPQVVLGRDYAFPIIGPHNFSNDFSAPRSNGIHHAIDIFADKHQRIVSRTDGVISFVGYPQPSWGYAVFIEGDNGKTYRYLHINNDTPGTDDGSGGGYYAYAPDVVVGKRVIEGQLLGYVGDSGNAEDTPPHLHFEIYDGDDPINPYYGLVNSSYHLSSPRAGYPIADDEFLPMRSSFRGGVSVAVGDVDDDGIDEIVTGSGPGGTYVRIFEVDGTKIGEFQPNGASFTGGIDVATGDIDNDTFDEIITGPGAGGRFIKVFEMDGERLSRFAFAGSDFEGGADVAAGDIDGDGTDEIITGSGPGGKLVKTFTPLGVLIRKIQPYGDNFDEGLRVTAADRFGDPGKEVVTGTRRGAKPRISVFDEAGARLDSFYAYDETFLGGMRLDAANYDAISPGDEIFVVPASQGRARAKMIRTSHSTRLSDYFAEVWWKGPYDVAASDTNIYTALGVNRRSSIREATSF